tara:strand:- start:937 stop:1086 length:150 start_codon:yes stop_codon:yes gene_type:complete
MKLLKKRSVLEVLEVVARRHNLEVVKLSDGLVLMGDKPWVAEAIRRGKK